MLRFRNTLIFRLSKFCIFYRYITFEYILDNQIISRNRFSCLFSCVNIWVRERNGVIDGINMTKALKKAAVFMIKNTSTKAFSSFCCLYVSELRHKCKAC